MDPTDGMQRGNDALALLNGTTIEDDDDSDQAPRRSHRARHTRKPVAPPPVKPRPAKQRRVVAPVEKVVPTVVPSVGPVVEDELQDMDEDVDDDRSSEEDDEASGDQEDGSGQEDEQMEEEDEDDLESNVQEEEPSDKVDDDEMDPISLPVSKPVPVDSIARKTPQTPRKAVPVQSPTMAPKVDRLRMERTATPKKSRLPVVGPRRTEPQPDRFGARQRVSRRPMVREERWGRPGVRQSHPDSKWRGNRTRTVLHSEQREVRLFGDDPQTQESRVNSPRVACIVTCATVSVCMFLVVGAQQLLYFVKYGRWAWS